MTTIELMLKKFKYLQDFKYMYFGLRIIFTNICTGKQMKINTFFTDVRLKLISLK